MTDSIDHELKDLLARGAEDFSDKKEEALEVEVRMGQLRQAAIEVFAVSGITLEIVEIEHDDQEHNSLELVEADTEEPTIWSLLANDLVELSMANIADENTFPIRKYNPLVGIVVDEQLADDDKKHALNISKALLPAELLGQVLAELGSTSIDEVLETEKIQDLILAAEIGDMTDTDEHILRSAVRKVSMRYSQDHLAEAHDDYYLFSLGFGVLVYFANVHLKQIKLDENIDEKLLEFIEGHQLLKKLGDIMRRNDIPEQAVIGSIKAALDEIVE